MDKIILGIICFFFVFGGIDFAIGNRLQVGEKFEEGLKTMGPLAIGMVGIYSLSPLFATVITTIINPVAKLLSLDPSLFPAMILASDMGSYALAKKIAFSKEMGIFSGVILSSMLGTTISFTIPMAIGMVDKKDHEYLSKGIMAGIITIPLGCLVGGIIQGIHGATLAWNLMPIIIFAILLSVGLIRYPKKVFKRVL